MGGHRSHDHNHNNDSRIGGADRTLSIDVQLGAYAGQDKATPSGKVFRDSFKCQMVIPTILEMARS